MPARNEVFNIYGNVSYNENLYDHEETAYFHVLMHKSVRETQQGGWKLHIALTPDENQVRQALNVVFPILEQYQAKMFKVVHENSLSTTQPGNVAGQGKTITIFLVQNPEFQQGGEKHQHFLHMLYDIEQGLISQNIVAGERAAIDLPIPGSQFISCRNDAGNRDYQLENRSWAYLQVDMEQAQALANQSGHPVSNPTNKPDDYNLQGIDLSLAPAPLNQGWCTIN